MAVSAKAFTSLSLVVAVAFGGAQARADTRVQVSSGIDYSSGDYGETTNTEILSLPFAARVSCGAWSVRASIPYVTVRGPADVSEIINDTSGSSGGSNSGSGSSGSGSGSGSSGGGGADDGSGGSDAFAASRNVSGIGDASVAVTYSFDDISASPAYLDLTGRVRLPTGSERDGLGVGATDYAASAELGWDGDIGGMFVSAGRRFLGEVSDRQRVDGWQASVGTWINAGRRIVIGAYYDWRDSSVLAGADVTSAQAYMTVRLSPAWKVEVYGGAGLSRGNADYNVGMTLTWRTSSP